jgi:hypothetical protein
VVGGGQVLSSAESEADWGAANGAGGDEGWVAIRGMDLGRRRLLGARTVLTAAMDPSVGEGVRCSLRDRARSP